MTDDLELKKWTRLDKAILWGVALLCVFNLIIGLLTLGPDILHW
jgi:hypothetical protein